MDIEYKGANCVVLSTKQHTVVTDPKLSRDGLKDYGGKMSVGVATYHDLMIPAKDTLIVDGPGEYELEGGVSIKGIAAQRNMDTPEQGKRATMYRIEMSDISVAVVGHVVEKLTESQLESIGVIDVLVVPVGGNGYTLDAHGAVQVVRQIDPKVIIPVHYADPTLKYEVPQGELETFLKELGISTVADKVSKLKLKSSILPEVLTIQQIAITS